MHPCLRSYVSSLFISLPIMSRLFCITSVSTGIYRRIWRHSAHIPILAVVYRPFLPSKQYRHDPCRCICASQHNPLACMYNARLVVYCHLLIFLLSIDDQLVYVGLDISRCFYGVPLVLSLSDAVARQACREATRKKKPLEGTCSLYESLPPPKNSETHLEFPVWKVMNCKPSYISKILSARVCPHFRVDVM